MTTTSVQRDIFQRRVAGVAEEMSAALRRSAFSSIIWEMYDYSCALLRPDGVMLAQAETIAAQLGIMEYACRRIDEELPIRDWQEGDVVVCNDPYRGCTHTPDVVLFAPIFANGERQGSRRTGRDGSKAGTAHRNDGLTHARTTVT